MPTSLKDSRPARYLLILSMVAIVGLCDDAWAGERQKQVLVLYATRRDAQIAVVGDRELPRILEQGLSGDVDYYSEFIDQSRFTQPDYQSGVRDFLRLKYREKRFDLVIAMGEIPMAFVDSTRALLFAETPVVFFANNPPQRLPNSTGVTARLNLGDTIRLASALQPDLRHVFIVSGAGASQQAFEKVARAQFRQFEHQFELTYLSGLRTKDLEARLASLPSRSIVYYLVVDRDGAGENFNALDYLDRVTAASKAPVYCWVDSAINHGIVGGSLKDQRRQVQAIAELALKVLRGERADQIPVSNADLNVSQVDWRQLRRWGISEARVPAGTLIKFREPSVWDRYRIYVLGAIAILLAQMALIAGLLVQRTRRRRAERQLRAHEAELQTSYDRIRDLGARLLNAQETERSHIARELHDDVSQQMALLEIDLAILGRGLQGEAVGLISDALNRAQGVARSVHDLSHRLHPAKLRLIGLVAAIHGLQREVSSSNIKITVTHDGVPPALPPELTLCLFRIVQEALQNAVKYSRAHDVSVTLRGRPETLTLTIADDGAGFDVATAWGKGLGLISMSERVEAIGGTFDIRSNPGSGTRLEVTVPVQVDNDAKSVAV